MPPSLYPPGPAPLDWPAHDWCEATHFCRRCGASRQAVARAERAMRCEPGVTGISWARASERMRDLMAMFDGPMVALPVYRLDDFGSRNLEGSDGGPIPPRLREIKPGDEPNAA